MSKALAATCVGGVVKAEGLPVPGTQILSEGVAQSEGLLILQGEERTYIAKITPDLKSAIEQAASALGQAASALTETATAITSILSGMTGPTTAPPPTVAANVASITAAVVQINLSKAQLDTLKGALK